MAIDLKKLEKLFYADGYRLGVQAAETGLTKDAVYMSARKLHAMTDELIDSFYSFAESNNQLPACKKGCHWCCHQPVFALSYELDLLNDFIENEFNDETKRRIRSRAADKRKKLSVLAPGEVLYSKIPCPLLEDGVCMAYQVRPVACRIYLSSSLPSCLEFFNEPEKDDSIPALLQFPMQAGRMLNEGLKAALKTHGLIIEEYRIEEMPGN